VEKELPIPEVVAAYPFDIYFDDSPPYYGFFGYPIIDVIVNNLGANYVVLVYSRKYNMFSDNTLRIKDIRKQLSSANINSPVILLNEQHKEKPVYEEITNIESGYYPILGFGMCYFFGPASSQIIETIMR